MKKNRTCGFCEEPCGNSWCVTNEGEIDMPVDKAKKELEIFLDKNPSLKEFQEKLDEQLSKAPDAEGRVAILRFHIEDNFARLNKELEQLKDLLLKIK